MTTSSFRKDHIATLDGLRACAVLLVMWQHIPALMLPLAIHRTRAALLGDFADGQWPLQIDWLRNQVFAAGYLGVDIFFVLSGFLITRILLFDKSSGVPLRHFMLRRILRIFPIYYPTLLVVALVQPGRDLLWCAVYLSNFYYLLEPGGVMQHSWSLAVEEHFYLVWPLIVYGCSTSVSRRAAACVIVPGAILCTAGLAWWQHDDVRFTFHAAQYGTMFRMGSLGCGALLAYAESGLRARPRSTLVAALALLAIGASMRATLPLVMGGTSLAVVHLVGFMLTSTGLVMTCIATAKGHSWFARLLRSSPMRFVGRISYGLYLYHHVIYDWVGLPIVPDSLDDYPVIALLTTAIGLSFLVAAVSYALIERPCLRWASRFRRP